MRSLRSSSLLLVLGALAGALVACRSGSDGKPPDSVPDVTPPVPVPVPPVVNSFTAGPVAVAPGGSAVLSWDVASATTIRIEPGIGPVGVTTTAAVTPAATTAYVLTASNEAGDATAVVTVSVAAAVAPAGWADVGAEPQSAVTAGPRVHVIDAGGRAVAGMDVSFVVSVGGGSVERATAVTDASGDASCGRWTLGPARGPNTVVASVPGLPPVTFTALGVTSSPSISVFLYRDSNTRLPVVLPATVFHVVGTSYSPYSSVASATATVWARGRSIALPSSSYLGQDMWRFEAGSALDGVGWGPALIVVTMADAFGNSTDAVFPAVVDRPPRVIVTAPFRNALARPKIRIEARCEDDDPAGCVAMEVRAYGFYDFASPLVPRVPIAAGTTAISQDVDLSSWVDPSLPSWVDPRAPRERFVILSFYAKDAVGQESAEPTHAELIGVRVNADPTLSVLHALPGTVLDVVGPRVLFLDQRGDPPRLMLRDTSSGAEDVLETSYAEPRLPLYDGPSLGKLTNAGAIYRYGCFVAEWRAGSRVILAPLAPPAGCGFWAADNDFAAYLASTDSGPTLVRRDLAAGLDATILQTTSLSSLALASNGDVAYMDSGDVYRWRDGATLKLTAGNPYTFFSGVATNGALVLYNKNSCALAAHDGSSERILNWYSSCGGGIDYAVADGWIAYTVEDANGVFQVWREGAAGASQATFQNASSTICALAPDGTLLFESNGVLSRVRGGTTAPEVIGSPIPRRAFAYRDGRLVVLLGNMVLTLPQ